MTNKRRNTENEATYWVTILVKVIITLLVLNVTIGAFAVVIMFLYHLTGWLVVASGLMITTIAMEIRAIWGRKDKTPAKHTRNHRKTRNVRA